LQTPAKERVTVNLPLLGAHNVTNALAAAAIAIALDIPLEKIKEGLETAAPEYGRLNIKTGINKATIIDDSYNANPSSVKAAIDILTGRDTNTIFVFGDMKELGEMTISAHQDIGVYAKEKGVKKMFCYGEQSALAAKAFGEAACHFMDQDALITALKPYLTEKTSVLVKGSNGMKMNNIVERLCS